MVSCLGRFLVAGSRPEVSDPVSFIPGDVPDQTESFEELRLGTFTIGGIAVFDVLEEVLQFLSCCLKGDKGFQGVPGVGF